MIKKRHIESLLLFGLAVSLPLLKVYLLAHTDQVEQQRYIRVYFWLQFLVPLMDFGYYWTVVRERVTNAADAVNLNALSIGGLVLALVLVPINIFYALLVLLATVTAWHNFRLQVFRIEGDTRAYYRTRLGKVVLDLGFVGALVLLSQLKVELLLATELLAILLVGLVPAIRRNSLRDFRFFGIQRLFKLEFLYNLISVARANLVRISVPLLFVGHGMEAVVFAILFYELLAQYLSIEKLRDLLAGKVRVYASVGLYLASLPLQIAGIYVLSKLMLWEFTPLDFGLVILGGTARIFGVYTLKAIKHDGFGLVVLVNAALVVLGALEILLLHQFVPGENAARLAMLIYYFMEVLIGGSIIVWGEKRQKLEIT